MSFLWEGVKQMSQMAGAAALLAGQKTKLRGEIMLVEREVKSRQQLFGIELYDFVAPLAKSPDFFAANDQMTDVIRGPFLGAQREIAALMIKRGKLKEELAQAEVSRKAAFPAPATTFGEQVLNTGKATAFTANEVRIKTEISMVDAQIRGHKEEFGEVMFDVFVKLEDEQGWLPTVRDIRTMYDKARQEVDKLKAKMMAKEQEIANLGTEGDHAAATFSTTATTSTAATTATMYGSSSSMASTSAHSRPSPLGPQLVVAAPAPTSAPVPALESTFSTHYPPPPTATTMAPVAPASLSSSSDHYRAPPPPPQPREAVSGLFLGMSGGDAASTTMGSGAGVGVRKQTQQTQSSSFQDPFAMNGNSSYAAGGTVDPFAPIASQQPQQQQSMDPFGTTSTFHASSSLPPPVVPNDPFSFTQTAQPPASLPYDPFSSTAGSSSSNAHDDPFADLVASGRR